MSGGARQFERGISGLGVGEVKALLFNPGVEMLLNGSRRCAVEKGTIFDDL